MAKESDIFYGGNGDDIFVGAGASHGFQGSDGSRRVDFRWARAAIQIGLAKASPRSPADDGTDILRNITGMFGSAYADSIWGSEGDDFIEGDCANTLSGDAGNDRLDSSVGSDLLYGDGGNDLLHGGYGSDSLMGEAGSDGIGGSGFDSLSYHAVARAVRIDRGTLDTGDAAGDIYSSIENCELSPFDDGFRAFGESPPRYRAGGHDLLSEGRKSRRGKIGRRHARRDQRAERTATEAAVAGTALVPDPDRSLAVRFMNSAGLLDIDRVADAFRMSKNQLAETTGLGLASVAKTSRHAAPKTQTRVREMLEIINRVKDWAGGETQAMAWYRSQPLPALDGRTPEALVKSGRAAAVRDYLDHFALGGYA